MKKEINAHIYKTTLEYLEDRIDIYSGLLAAAQDGSEKTRRDVSDMLTACKQIRESYISTYMPAKAARTNRMSVASNTKKTLTANG